VIYLLVGFAGFIAMALLSQAAVRSNPGQVAGVMRKVVGTGAILVAGLLTLRGMLPMAVPVFLFGLQMLGMRQPYGWPGQNGAGKTSRVETSMLTMELDHDTGTIDGTVRAGSFAGRSLSSLALPELFTLRDECSRATDQSLTLIEAYLDRREPDWRQSAAGGSAHAGRPPPGARGAMSRSEALSVLGLREGASEADIKAAHRRMMKVVHPDRGGSADLAARINLAKDVLLG
jgi:hypothetical protein